MKSLHKKSPNDRMTEQTKKIAQVIFENLDGEPSKEYRAQEAQRERENAKLLEELYIKTGQKKAPSKRKYLTRDDFRAHQKWVERGQTGEGRIELEDGAIRTTHGFITLTGARFVRCHFRKAHHEYMGFEGAELIECTFEGNFTMASFEGAALDYCTFKKAVLVHTNFEDADMRGCDFTGSQIDRSTWEKTKARKCIFKDTTFEETSFKQATFSDCDFRNAKLMQVDDNGVNAEAIETIFERCDFRGAVFTGLQIKNTQFTHCNLDPGALPI